MTANGNNNQNNQENNNTLNQKVENNVAFDFMEDLSSISASNEVKEEVVEFPRMAETEQNDQQQLNTNQQQSVCNDQQQAPSNGQQQQAPSNGQQQQPPYYGQQQQAPYYGQQQQPPYYGQQQQPPYYGQQQQPPYYGQQQQPPYYGQQQQPPYYGQPIYGNQNPYGNQNAGSGFTANFGQQMHDDFQQQQQQQSFAAKAESGKVMEASKEEKNLSEGMKNAMTTAPNKELVVKSEQEMVRELTEKAYYTSFTDQERASIDALVVKLHTFENPANGTLPANVISSIGSQVLDRATQYSNKIIQASTDTEAEKRVREQVGEVLNQLADEAENINNLINPTVVPKEDLIDKVFNFLSFKKKKIESRLAVYEVSQKNTSQILVEIQKKLDDTGAVALKSIDELRELINKLEDSVRMVEMYILSVSRYKEELIKAQNQFLLENSDNESVYFSNRKTAYATCIRKLEAKELNLKDARRVLIISSIESVMIMDQHTLLKDQLEKTKTVAIPALYMQLATLIEAEKTRDANEACKRISENVGKIIENTATTVAAGYNSLLKDANSSAIPTESFEKAIGVLKEAHESIKQVKEETFNNCVESAKKMDTLINELNVVAKTLKEENSYEKITSDAKLDFEERKNS